MGHFLGARFILAGAALAFAVLFAPRAGAQDSSGNTVTLPTIVVSPTTVPTPGTEVGSSVTVITADDIARQQYRTVPAALGEVPGLNVVQTGGPGGQTAVFIRGTNANHVKVLIDGVDASDPSNPNGAFDFGQLLTGDIERIEILRGPQSGLYGSDAIGGVISITTKKGEGPPKLTGSVEAGSFGTFNQTASASGSQGNINYAFNVLHYQSTSTPVTPLNLLPPGVKRINDTYNNWTYSTRLGADVTDNVAVNLTARYIDTKLGFTGEDYFNYFPPAPESLQSTQRNHKLFSRGELVWSLLDGKFTNYFGLDYTNQWTWYSNPNADNFPPAPPVAPPTTTVGIRTKVDWRGVVQIAQGQTLVFGLEKQDDRLRTDSTTDPLGRQFTTTASNGNQAGYVELQSAFAKRFFLVSNIRYDDNESFGPHTTWRVAPAVDIYETGTKLKASYGTGFKAPTLVELYVDYPPFFFANPALKPEESTGYDAGFEQSVLQDRLRFGATYFHNDVTNLIAAQTDPVKFISTYVNVNQSVIKGYETFATWAVNSQLKLRADYTFTHVDATSFAAYLRRPSHKYGVTAIWTPTDALQISAALVSVSGWFDYDRAVFTTLNAPGYTVVNLAARYKVNDKVQVFGRIDNLFDQHYENPTGFLRPGFGIFGGVRVANR